ncbi:hypothetical protein CFT12S00416_07855 [Campylobacter fetus subsp. testudinum]|uniref:hypothetical protein n=1 Tax=Campylobacter fetus TaxID=196 RepID=UPI000818A938|nr:hypothetical protein [Campylobacter fetus]OCR87732.1 hypothetical protein CFT12S00416_07855 [Campylobacter fetus subsp. testudinum]OCR98846.1 hypothetical protein A9K75_09660 [Campylobacter fetus subsp. testudinum]
MIKYIILFYAFILNLVANSTNAISNLADEHKNVNDIHATELQTTINKKELDKYILLQNLELIYELEKYSYLLYNNYLINTQRDFLIGK